MSSPNDHDAAGDRDVLAHIHDLVAEEKTLRAGQHGLDSDQRRRLEAIEIELDRYWDLLRQRRAHEEYGENPDTATERSTNEVEGYLQ